MGKNILFVMVLLGASLGLSGCAAMWFGGGAAGGYYAGSHYKVESRS